MEMIRDHIQAESLKPNGLRKEDDQVSLDQYIRNLGGNEKTLAMANLWVRVMHGLESTEESAAWFIEYCRTNHGLLAIRADDHTGGNYMRIKAGKFDKSQEVQEIATDLKHRYSIYRQGYCRVGRCRQDLPL